MKFNTDVTRLFQVAPRDVVTLTNDILTAEKKKTFSLAQAFMILLRRANDKTEN